MRETTPTRVMNQNPPTKILLSRYARFIGAATLPSLAWMAFI
jgi:hypothetical protein